LSKILQLPLKLMAIILFITGLVIGVWHGYRTAIGSNVAYYQSRLIFDLMMLVTFLLMLIWTFARRVRGAHDGRSSPSRAGGDVD